MKKKKLNINLKKKYDLIMIFKYFNSLYKQGNYLFHIMPSFIHETFQTM